MVIPERLRVRMPMLHSILDESFVTYIFCKNCIDVCGDQIHQVCRIADSFLVVLCSRSAKKICRPKKKTEAKAEEKKNNILGCRHSLAGTCAPSILLPWVQVPSTPSMLLSFEVKFVVYLSLHCEKSKNKQKEAGFGPFK